MLEFTDAGLRDEVYTLHRASQATAFWFPATSLDSILISHPPLCPPEPPLPPTKYVLVSVAVQAVPTTYSILLLLSVSHMSLPLGSSPCSPKLLPVGAECFLLQGLPSLRIISSCCACGCSWASPPLAQMLCENRVLPLSGAHGLLVTERDHGSLLCPSCVSSEPPLVSLYNQGAQPRKG